MSMRTPPTLIGAAAAAVLALTTLTGCTVFDSVVQGVSSGVGGAFSGSDDDADSGTGSSQPTTPDVVIEVRFDGARRPEASHALTSTRQTAARATGRTA